MKHISNILILSALFSATVLMYGWQAPVTLTPEWNDASVPWLSFDAENNAMLVCRVFDGEYTRVQATQYNATAGSWSTPNTISPTTHAREPKVVVNNAGNAMAIWRLVAGINNAIQASFYNGASWDVPYDLGFISDPNYDAMMPDIAINNSNNVVACWELFDGATWIVQSAVQESDQVWSSAADLSFSGSYGFAPQVVMTDTTTPAVAVVFYGIIENSGINSVQLVTSLDGGYTWTAPVAISSIDTGAAFVPQIAIDGDGNIIVVWQIQLSDGSWTIQARKMSATEWQNTPDPVSSSNTKNLASGIMLNAVRSPNVRIAMNKAGKAVITWYTTVGNTQQVQAVLYDGITVWALWNGTVVNISDQFTPINAADWPLQRVAIDGNGNAVVVWQEYATTGELLIYASYYNVNTATWNRSTLSLPGQEATLPYVALSADGQGFAAWKQTNGNRLTNPIYTIQVSQY